MEETIPQPRVKSLTLLVASDSEQRIVSLKDFLESCRAPTLLGDLHDEEDMDEDNDDEGNEDEYEYIRQRFTNFSPSLSLARSSTRSGENSFLQNYKSTSDPSFLTATSSTDRVRH